MTKRIITSSDIITFNQLKAQIDALTSQLDSLKDDFRDSFPIGELFESGDFTIQVRRGAPTFSEAKFVKAFPENKNPRLYKVVPDRKVISMILDDEEREPFFTETKGSVYITPKKVVA